MQQCLFSSLTFLSSILFTCFQDFPILYISVDSEEEKQAGGYSYCNPVEANIVVDYADYLIETTKVAPEDIGVISPYTYQSKFITDLMKKHRNSKKLARVIVNSVERFQVSFVFR